MQEAGIRSRPTVLGIAICLFIVMALRFYLSFTYEINWDEFLNLSMVHDFARGDLKEPLQTAFVHGFHWVSAISSNEVDQVVAARMIMFAIAASTVFLIFAIARQFMPLHAALFAALCFAAYTYTVRQGASFRTDTIAAGVLMTALWVIVTRALSWYRAAFAGGLIGLAGMITVKAIFYAPVIATILLLNLVSPGPKGPAFRYGLTVAVTALAVFGVCFAAHWTSLADSNSALVFLERTTGKTMGSGTNHVLAEYFFAGVAQNPVFWIALVFGLLAILLRMPQGTDRVTGPRMLSFSLILGSLLIYSESYPYFYPFILPPVAVLCGAWLMAFSQVIGQRLALLGAVAVTAHFCLTLPGLLAQNNHGQRQTLDVVHKMFPDPVPYIDRTSMVSAFPKKGPFLSVWGMTQYYDKGEAEIAAVIKQDQPLFVVANRHMLEFENLVPERAGINHFGFLLPDIEALRNNYIQHWGRIYVAGKEVELDAGVPKNFLIQISGPYTLETIGQVRLNGQVYSAGAVVDLPAGQHRLSSETSRTVTLRWGKDLYLPEELPPSDRLFTGF